jgi:hypothetical protein
MNKTYSWDETTTGHIMSVNGKYRWFIKKDDNRFEVYEIVKQPNDCALREVCFNLNTAKHRAYLIECNENNSRYDMELVQ